MIVWAGHGEPLYAPLVEFITGRIWGSPREMSDGTVLAVTEGNAVIGACLFHNWQPDDGVVELTSASVSPRWLSRPVLQAMFDYAFDRLRCQAAVMRVDPANTRMCRIAEAFGFKRYDIPRLRGRDKAEALFILGDDEWRGGKFYQEKCHGQKAPAPTPATETSAAATGTNISTAIANAYLTNMNETGPDGSKTFDQTGMTQITDPYTGKTYDIPRFSVTQTLSDQQQAIKGQNDAASLNLATLGNNLSGTLGEQLTGNFKLGNEAVESRLFDLGRQRLDPMFAQRDEDLRTRLANQGIKAGSQAYDREMGLQGQQQNDAYNSLLLSGRGQATNELLTEDNQRINQISALLNGGQVSMPNFMTGNAINPAATTDNASIIANNDNQRLASWQQSQAAMGSAIGGLGGLFALSDERVKDDMRKIGETDDGLNLYSYRMKGSPETQVGLKAQDVKKKKPSAVAKGADGLLRVDYKKAVA